MTPCGAFTWFQFHIGSIKAPGNARSAAWANPFQFHIGSIKAPYLPGTKAALKHVSIPHWFDQGWRLPQAHMEHARFQFHIGSIKALMPHTWRLPQAQFQFHIGSIKALVRFGKRTLTQMFQFHIGSIKASTA